MKSNASYMPIDENAFEPQISASEPQIIEPQIKDLSVELLADGGAGDSNTLSTPDQNIVEDLASYAGINNPEGHPLRTLRTLNSRDEHRWELEPESSEDYPEHDL